MFRDVSKTFCNGCTTNHFFCNLNSRESLSWLSHSDKCDSCDDDDGHDDDEENNHN